jgi:hypothetical protein
LIEVTINSLATFISSPKLTLDFVYLSATAKNFIFRQIKFLKACASGNAFIQTIHQWRSPLFLDIILQFAACDPSELDTMGTQPQEFVNFALDCITKQKSGVPKSEAIGLFEILCDNLDGFSTYSLSILINTFEVLVRNPDKNFTEDILFVDVKEITDHAFWKNYTSEQNIETI